MCITIQGLQNAVLKTLLFNEPNHKIFEHTNCDPIRVTTLCTTDNVQSLLASAMAEFVYFVRDK